MKKIKVHEFDMPFDDEPMTWVGAAMHEWRQTTKAKWIMDNTNPSYHVTPNRKSKRGYKVKITTEMEDKLLSYYYLKWPK